MSPAEESHLLHSLDEGSLMQVLQSLDDAKDLAKLQLTCKGLGALAKSDSLWSALLLCHYGLQVQVRIAKGLLSMTQHFC